MKPHSTRVLLALALGGPLLAQGERGLAITNARILTMAGPEIARGAVLVRNGKIEQVGADVAVPAGYEVVDAAGGTLMPGSVSVYTHAGLQTARTEGEPRPNVFRGRGGRRGGRGGAPAASGDNKAAERVVDGLYARQDVFRDTLRAGVTTLGLAPMGRGLPGFGAILRPAGDSAEAMTLVAEGFQTIAPVVDTKTKDLVRKALADAKREIEARKRRAQAAAEKAAAEKAAADNAAAGEGEAEKPKEGDAPTTAQGGRGGQAAAPAEPEPAIAALADLLEGKSRALVALDSANDVEHFLDTLGDASFPMAVVARRHAQEMSQGSLEVVLPQLRKWKCPIILAPEFGTLPNTQFLVSLPARLHGAGCEIGFLVPDGARAMETLRAQLLELVRAGLPASVALAGITAVPAKALGIDKTVGTVAVGKTANLQLWTADPLDPLASLRAVWLEGRLQTEESK